MREQLAGARIKMIRWRILAVLNAGRPYPVGETLIADVLTDVDLQTTQSDIRNALQYLADKGFCELTSPPVNHWEARLLPRGVDFVEYNLPDEPGIIRPPRG